MTKDECRFQVSWSKDGSLGKSKRSEPLATLGAAQRLAQSKCAGNRCVTILREDPQEINRGKFFLYLIIK